MEKIIEVLVKAKDYLLFCWVINQYDRGVKLRWGKRIRKKKWLFFPTKDGELQGPLKPGFHWKWPIADVVLDHLVVPTTLDLDAQTVTTKDGISVVIEASLKYEVKNIIKLMLETNGATDALKDVSRGVIRDVLIQKDWANCNDTDTTKQMTDEIKKVSREWGISVLQLRVSTLARMTSTRIIASGTTKISLHNLENDL